MAGRPRWPVLLGIGLYTVTSLVGAGLLFAVEPMVAKMLLPAYGGSPMVWNTAVLFFQGALLAGYAYAHWSQRRLGARRQPLVHIALVLLPLIVLPISLPSWSVAPESTPTALWLLLVLVVMVGAPFAVLATTGPLVQRWYSWSGLPRAGDPYFLYAAGNVGSFVALLAYPFLIEPAADVGTQARWWTVCYVAFAGFMITCAILVRWQARGAQDDPPSAAPLALDAESAATVEAAEEIEAVETAEEVAAIEAVEEKVGWRRRARWLGLAFVPSSLFLGITTHISTDIAAVPLMWVVPLALYLATFIIAFSATRHRWLTTTVRPAALSAPFLPWVLVAFGPHWGVLLLPLDLALVLTAGLACHGLLANDRPSPRRLTEFFLYVSMGGALGGAFNALLAPIVFNWGAELPIVIAALALLPVAKGSASNAVRRFTFPGSWVLSTIFLLIAPTVAILCYIVTDLVWAIILSVAITVIWGCWIVRRPQALVFSAICTVAMLFLIQVKAAPVQERTFFGSYRVNVSDGRRVFSHGSTLHGFQSLKATERRTPTAYYSRNGPLGDVFAGYGDRPTGDRVAVIGLGTGTVAAYGRAGQRMDFYEIDPAVVRIARSHFTYLRDCDCEARTIVGDGRLEIERMADGTYGTIVLDAFSSDAIPAHLLTREAIQIYARKLAPGGVLAFNVSNRNLDLAPMLASTARANGLSVLAADDPHPSNPLAFASVWVAIGRTDADLRPLTTRDPRWQPVPNGPVWTDGYSSIFGILRLRL
ncbi:fused MFS/spermidine synthase [Actinomadura sp. HBU206391]|uniref:fused MFS/spermidine synthase n=1 Tax=Actinomadura sp. HBU206391 TaxID=2731692 RepID=UPI001650A4F9|nr:fused MFS/spermidine synthase [Actinomadura sp. HBU206391]MBC6458355.1 fused MFS/spermidine synthase [Actinomadura sp. HBU206391]